MARRHEDREPGQRFARSGTAKKTAKKAPAKKAAKKAPAKKAPAKRGTSLRTAPVKRAPLRGSKRMAEGLTVKPSPIFAGSAVNKDGKVRVNHFLAKSGVCSRRAADELVADGRVMVNGEVIREHGVRVDPDTDEVYFDGVRLQPERSVYVLLNKPKNVVCTSAAHEKKKRVVDLLPTIRGRVFTVGRLDMDSEGLLMVTNDGAFAQEMTHPRYGVGKLYSIVVRGRIEDKDLTKARGGVWLSEGPTAGMEIKIDRLAKERTFLKVTLREGKNREIRRVFAKLGYPVTSLKRIRIGPLTLHGLREGKWRFLQLDEVAKLRDIAREELAKGGAKSARPRNAFAESGVRPRTTSRPASKAVAKKGPPQKATGKRGASRTPTATKRKGTARTGRR